MVKVNGDGSLEKTLKDLLIVQLAAAGLSNHEIRKIAGCALGRVSKIATALKKAKKRLN
jgi:hypothetical protein